MAEGTERDNLNPKKRGLGRGLNALFEDEEGVYPQPGPDGHAPGREKHMMGIDRILPNPHQPRRHIDEDTIRELAASIKEHGVLQPLLVRPKPHDNDYYEIIAGERRWRAAQKAQLHEVPVVILDLPDAKAYEIALIENLQREDINPVDEADGYKKMLDDYGYTQEQLAKKIGKSRSHIANMIRLTALPPLAKDYLAQGGITIGHARALLTCKEPEPLLKMIVDQGLSVRQTEKLVAAQDPARPKKTSGPRSKKTKDVDTLALEEELSKTLGMKVTIDNDGGETGSVKIDYKSLDQLDEVLHRLSHFPGSRLSG